MIKTLVIIIAITSLMISCKHNNTYQEINDKDITLQVIKLPSKNKADSSLTFKVRLIPHAAFDASGAWRENLLFRMDSCFYLKEGDKIIYPELTQEVANGIKNNFEYLVSFENAPITEATPGVNLFYKDRFLNHRLYKFKTISLQ